MPSDLILRHLKHLTRTHSGVYECEELDGYVVRTTDGYMFQAHKNPDASITVVPTHNESVLIMDRFVGAVMETPVPYIRIRKANTGNYCYDPWRMVIEVAEFNPGWGNTFKGGYRLANGHFDLNLNRLKNLRAFLKHVKALQEAREHA